jgi:hypothetical protein
MFNEHTDNNLGQDTIARCIASSVPRQMIRSGAWPDDLVMLSGIPHHLVQKVLPQDMGSVVHGIPGPRCLGVGPVARHRYRFLHRT